MIASPANRFRQLFGLTTAMGIAAWAGMSAVIAPSSAADGSLGSLAATKGKYFGTAVSSFKLDDPKYVEIINSEFTSVTPENETKWDATEPSRGSFSFGPADRILDTVGRGKKVRGHTLVWHSQLAGWVTGLNGTDVQKAMDDHIAGVAGHFRGKIYSWDVVNEALNGDGSRRHTVFQDKIGDGYIERAFRDARAADPDAKLCYNDYNIESHNAKSDAVYEMVKDFKSRGVPIDCVGFQTHLGSSVPGDFQTNLQRFAALGVEVPLTELDIEGSLPSTYAQVVQACLAVAGCSGITVWGVRDSDSWRGGSPLLFDSNGNQKESHSAVISVLRS
jgi:endo-1,4-beta-xylanase